MNNDTNLFLVRLRTAPGSDGPLEWQGSVVNIHAGEARHFADWPTLIDILLEMQAEWEESRLNMPLLSTSRGQIQLNS